MNNLMPRLKTAIALPGYKLLLEFEDGVNGEINLSLFKGNGVFEFWNDERNFINFKIFNYIVLYLYSFKIITLNFS